MKKNNKYTILGIMSGTSLDGIDMILTTFHKNRKWAFQIHKTQTYLYCKKWKKKLKELHLKDKLSIQKTDILYGALIAEKINEFIQNVNIKIDAISSHGHTIFHQPENNYTKQIGNGKTISDITKIKTINNFRELDVSLNGEGAPLVPIGDLHLFTHYKYCLNLGGFANISIKNNKEIIAFDICPANIVLNMLANKIGKEYDNNGDTAKGGIMNTIESAKRALSKNQTVDHMLLLKPLTTMKYRKFFCCGKCPISEKIELEGKIKRMIREAETTADASSDEEVLDLISFKVLVKSLICLSIRAGFFNK